MNHCASYVSNWSSKKGHPLPRIEPVQLLKNMADVVARSYFLPVKVGLILET